MNEILTPSLLWADFDETFHGAVTEAETDGSFRRFAAYLSDLDVTVETDIFSPSRETGSAVLIVGDLNKKAQSEVIEKMVSKGFTVVLPDYSGVFNDTLTKFPPQYEYGYYNKSGDHLKKVCPTAKETCYFLYSRIIRKIISAVKNIKADCDVVLMGMGIGTEIALQTAGTDERLKGLVLIGGAGYREYLDYPKFGSFKVLSVEGELVPWITAVSGTAYAKKINVPTVIAMGSNGKNSDIDRVSNIIKMIEAQTTFTVASGYRDNIDGERFETVLKWLETVFLDSLPPKNPSIKVGINEEGEIYGEISADDCIKIKEVRVKFSCGDNNHTTRFWEEIPGEFIGDGSYIAKLDSCGKNAIFAYPEVEYVNGFILDGDVEYCNLAQKKGKRGKRMVNPIVFQYPDERAFVEIRDEPVIFESSLKEGVLPIGLKGITCKNGGMVTYSIGEKSGFDETRLLQIDTYSDEKSYYLKVSVQDTDNREYVAVKEVECTDTFSSLILNVNSFKDENLQPLEKWDNIKSFTVLTSGVIVGKIMFI